MVQQGVDFDSGLGLPEPGPGEEAQAKADRGRIQGKELVFELEFVLGRDGSAAAVYLPEQGLEEGGRPLLVGLDKGGPGCRFDTPSCR